MISKCLSPVLIHNTDGSYRYVPCGQCKACKSLKMFSWKKRLESEMTAHRFTLFFTLTYDDQSLPTIRVFSSGIFTYNFFEDKPVIDSIPRNIMDDAVKYYRFYGGCCDIPVVCHSDITEFCRKLKTIIKDVRYYIQSEIGPSTLRPHYHGLLFFSSCSPDFAKDAICQVWTKCDWSIHAEFIHLVDSPSYVTSYVASSVDLPLLHQWKRFSMFSHKSSFPPIGSVAYDKSALSDFKYQGRLLTDCFHRQSLSYSEIPFLRFHKNRYFPKLPYDSSLSARARSFLLSSYDFFKHFADPKKLVSYGFKAYESVFDFFYNSSFWFTENVAPILTSESSVYRIYLTSKSFCDSWRNVHPLLRDFCLDLHEYNERMFELRQQYLYEQQFVSQYYEAKYLIFKDPVFCNTYGNDFGILPLWVHQTILGYGFKSDDDFISTVARYSLKFNPDQKKYFKSIDDILRESHKSNANNSYLASHGHPAYLRSGL